MYTESEVLDYVKEEDVKFVRLAFFDLSGVQKNISIMAEQLEAAFRDGVSFDASAVYGFEEPENSDLFLYPDPTTISILPWRPSTGKVVRMFCTIKTADGSEYPKDCRSMLRNIVKTAKDEYGLEFNIGTEIEFYLFKLDEQGNVTNIPFDSAGYMDIAPDDKGENIRRDICFTLEQMGIQPESSHHEEGPGQNEIDFHYSDALTAADNVATFKWIVHTKAQANGLYADFSPKPIKDMPGNGMHINISYRSLYGKNSEDLMPYILGGILKHIEEITYFLNPQDVSYLRLGSSKAPLYISWGKQNRSTLIRMPLCKNEQRLELRSPDPMCNPYIALTLIIQAALDGIKNKIQATSETKENLFNAVNNSHLHPLPQNLSDAKEIALNSSFVKSVLGKIVG